MGTVYANPAGRTYMLFGDRLAKSINQDLSKSKSKFLVNLASQEYFKAAREKNISADIISPVFKDEKNGNFKIISFYAKKARGYMSSFIIRNRIKDIEGLKQFSEEGYQLDPDQSTDSKPVFVEPKRIGLRYNPTLPKLGRMKFLFVRISAFFLESFAIFLFAAKPFQVVAYNVENLFDTDGISSMTIINPMLMGRPNFKISWIPSSKSYRK